MIVYSIFARGVYKVQVFPGFIDIFLCKKNPSLSWNQISDDGVEKPNQYLTKSSKIRWMSSELESGMEEGHEAIEQRTSVTSCVLAWWTSHVIKSFLEKHRERLRLNFKAKSFVEIYYDRIKLKSELVQFIRRTPLSQGRRARDLRGEMSRWLSTSSASCWWWWKINWSMSRGIFLMRIAQNHLNYFRFTWRRRQVHTRMLKKPIAHEFLSLSCSQMRYWDKAYKDDLLINW